MDLFLLCRKKYIGGRELKLFERRHVVKITCTFKWNPLKYHECAYSLQQNVQFSLETPNGNGNMPIPDLNINVNDERRISCHWYEKSTDTCNILNFRSCALLHFMKKANQGTVKNSFNASFSWQSFDVVLKKNQDIWTENQYPTE